MERTNLAVITSGFLPVPPTKGGAVENLLYNLVKRNEIEKKINFNYNQDKFCRILLYLAYMIKKLNKKQKNWNTLR